MAGAASCAEARFTEEKEVTLQRMRARTRNSGLFISHPIPLQCRFGRHFIAGHLRSPNRQGFLFAPTVSSSCAVKSHIFGIGCKRMEEDDYG